MDANDREIEETERKPAGEETERDRAGERDGCSARQKKGAAKREDRQWGAVDSGWEGIVAGDRHRRREKRELQQFPGGRN